MRFLDLPFLRRRAGSEVGLYLTSGGMAVASCPVDARRNGAPQVCVQEKSLAKGEDPAVALAAMVSAMRLQGAACNLVLAPEYYSLQLVDDPGVDPAELRDAVRWRIQDLLDFPAEDAVLDVFAMPPAAQRGRQAVVFVAALPNERLQQLVRLVEGAGLKLDTVDIAELALRNLAYLCYPSADQGIALLRMGKGGGLLTISRGDALFLARRIADLPSVLDESSWARVSDSLLLQVQRSIDYYESALNQPPAKGVLVSNASLLQTPVIEHLSAMLPLPVRTLNSLLVTELELALLDTDLQVLHADTLDAAQDAALSFAGPALGGLLRRILPRLLDDATDAAPAQAAGSH